MNADPESLHSFVLESLAAVPSTPSKEIRERLGIPQQTVYEADPEFPGGLIRVGPDGTRTSGIWVGKLFKPRG